MLLSSLESVVSFRDYLLSPEREKLIKQGQEIKKEDFGDVEPLQEALKRVYHADIENWLYNQEQ